MDKSKLGKPGKQIKTHGRIVPSAFKPAWWARNRHIQTIWPRFLQRRKSVQTRNQRLELPDGDFVDLTWADTKAEPRGLVVMFHGLEGSARSHYANDMLATLVEFGWQTVLMHFRSCSGEVNRTTRAYHSGETEDPIFLLKWLELHFPHLPKVGVGFSLGANMLLKMLGELPNQPWLKGAVAISPPFRLSECANSINQGFSRVYQRYLLKSMRNRLLTKLLNVDYSPFKLTPQKVAAIQSFRQFDELVTAPIHGFNDAEDYYERCSAIGFLGKIQTPTLILHAKDDPFMNHKVVPSEQDLAPSVRLELSSRGGHVGFMQGTPWAPDIWLHQRVPQFIADIFGHKLD